MSILLFWFFALLMLIGGVAVVSFRNPVSSALSMVLSFIGMAGLFIGLDAYFVGIIQILVYTGAVMVLFLFIIMLLNLKEEIKRPRPALALALAGAALALGLIIQITGVLIQTPNESHQPLDLAEAASNYTESSPGISEKLATGHLPDVHLIGKTLFEGYNFPLQILAVILLVATIAVVVLSKRKFSA